VSPSLRRVLALVPLLVLVSGVLLGGHLYLLERLVFDPGLAAPWSTLACAAVAGLALSIVAEPIAGRLLPPRGVRLVAWPAALWMGFAFLLLLLLLASDAALWLAGSPALAATAEPLAARSAAEQRAGLVVGLALLLGAAGMREALRPPRLRRARFEIQAGPPRWTAFASCSSRHPLRPILGRAFAQHLVERVEALAPDLVAVTGDLADGDATLLADEVAPLARLRARHGVYFVTGNHDHYSGASAWAARATALGMRVLRNERVRIGDADAGFDLVGVDDHHGRLVDSGGEDLAQALAGRDAARPAILLAHDPSTFRRARNAGIDLQLSGTPTAGRSGPSASWCGS